MDFDLLPSDPDLDDITVSDAVEKLRKIVRNQEFFLHSPDGRFTITADNDYFVWCSASQLVDGRCRGGMDDSTVIKGESV